MSMVTLIAGIALALQAPVTYPDRALFLKKLASLPDGTARSQVLQVLGKPDRIDTSEASEGSRKFTEETWLYGTDGGKGAATLARFDIYDGKLAYHPVNGKPPSPSVISEVELRKGMHAILDNLPREGRSTNRSIEKWVVKAVNALLPLGEAKCKAILFESARILEGYSQLNPTPYFLCFSLFEPPAKPGYFDCSGLVWNTPFIENPLSQPRWPIEIVHDVPVLHGEPLGGFGGFFPSFQSRLPALIGQIHLRKSPLAMPN